MWRRALSSLYDTPAARVVTTAAEIPSPRSLPLLGTMLDLMAAGGGPKLHEYIDARHRQLGPVFREYIGPVRVVSVADPNEMRRVFKLEGKYPRHLLPDSWLLYNKMYECKRGLFFMDGEEWLEYRRILNKLMLRPDSRSSILQPCEIVASDLVTQWKKKYSGRELLNLENDLYKWSIKVMIAVMMGQDYYKYNEELQDIVTELALVVQIIFRETGRLLLIPAKVAAFLKLPAWENFVSAIDESIRLSNCLMSKLVPLCQTGEGLLSAILAEGIQHEYAVRILNDFIFAAGDTTAYSTQWMLYLLATNTTFQEELHEEVQNVQNPDDIVQLPLLRGVMRESLRLYPSAPFITRYMSQDCQIGGYDVSAGELIMLPLYTSGRDERNFPKANEFCPQRWVRDAAGNYNGVTNAHASLPFAMGTRSCIGKRISEIQITLALAKIIQQFKIELINKKPVDIALRPITVPSEPIRLWLTQR